MNRIGTAPNQIPVNGLLGEMAFQDPAAVNITGGLIADKPVGTLVDQTALNLKVDKVTGQSLMLDAERTKLAGIAAGAQVNTVNSVAGRTGAVTLAKADVGLGNVDNTSDANKPVSTAQQTALNGKLDVGAVAADSSKLGGQAPSHYATQADLAGVTPGPEFYQRSNILGTVSQLNGVPTGAIIESGGNANGEYVRFAGGLQIAWLYLATTQAPTVAAGNLFRTAGETLHTPIDFAGIANSASGSTGDSNSWFAVEATSLNTFYVRRYSAYSNAVATPYRLTVIGRWH